VHADAEPTPRSRRSRDVLFTYSGGPWGCINVTQDDCLSLCDESDTRDAVIDALARYVWQEQLCGADRRDCLVFDSVFYRLLRSGGPSRVAAMTQRFNVFAFSTLVFFFCEGGHWWIGVLSDVPRLERSMSMSAGGAVHTGKPIATLAFFNSLRGVPVGTRARSTLLGWLRAESIRRGIGTGEDLVPPRHWVHSCISVVTPIVPQQSNSHECGLFALSFFHSFFSCTARDRLALLHPGAEGRAAWSAAFILKTRPELRALCNVLVERHRGRDGHGGAQGRREDAAELPTEGASAGEASKPAPALDGGSTVSIAKTATTAATKGGTAAALAGELPKPAPAVGAGSTASTQTTATTAATKGGTAAASAGESPKPPPAVGAGSTASTQTTATTAATKGGTAAASAGESPKPTSEVGAGSAASTQTTATTVATKGGTAAASAGESPKPASEVGAGSTASTQTTATTEATKGTTAGATAGDVPISSPVVGGSAAASTSKTATAAAANGIAHALYDSEHLELEGRLAKRRRVCSPHVAATAWLSALDKWSMKMEPEAAMEVVAVFLRCDGLFPSYFTHFAVGLVKGSPPASTSRLEPWFVAMLNEGSGSQVPGSSGGVSRVHRAYVHAVISAAYAFHGASLPAQE